MADYIIGDVQGCFEPLIKLLDHINYHQTTDRLWFVGDLVNRGPHSLEVLRFIKNLPDHTQIVLGNHDLYLLAVLFSPHSFDSYDPSLEQVLLADDALELGHWLRVQPFLIHDPLLSVVVTHAGIPPFWTLAQSIAAANELQAVFLGPNFQILIDQFYGNEQWSVDLIGPPRWRALINFFTRMRFCDAKGDLNFSKKGTLTEAPKGFYPWFAVPGRKEIETDIIFGHWASLNGISGHDRIHAIDTGCVWGKKLTAMRIQDKCRFSVSG